MGGAAARRARTWSMALTSMSNSRLTRRPLEKEARVVTAWVCGVIQQVKSEGERSAMVREMPSMVMEPRGMRSWWAFSGMEMTKRWSWPMVS